MPINFACPHCFRLYPPAPDDAGGRALACAGCGRDFAIPAPAAVAAPALLPLVPLPPEPSYSAPAPAAPPVPAAPQPVPAVPAAPAPVTVARPSAPRVVEWTPGCEVEGAEADQRPAPARTKPPARRSAGDEDEDEDEEDERALRRAREREWRLREERAARAKFWFWVKLSLLLIGLFGIVICVQLIVARWDAVVSPAAPAKPKVAPR